MVCEIINVIELQKQRSVSGIILRVLMGIRSSPSSRVICQFNSSVPSICGNTRCISVQMKTNTVYFVLTTSIEDD